MPDRCSGVLWRFLCNIAPACKTREALPTPWLCRTKSKDCHVRSPSLPLCRENARGLRAEIMTVPPFSSSFQDPYRLRTPRFHDPSYDLTRVCRCCSLMRSSSTRSSSPFTALTPRNGLGSTPSLNDVSTFNGQRESLHRHALNAHFHAPSVYRLQY